jgi:hypothetical protein
MCFFFMVSDGLISGGVTAGRPLAFRPVKLSIARSIDKKRVFSDITCNRSGVITAGEVGLANVYAIASRVAVGPSITLCLFVVAKTRRVAVDQVRSPVSGQDVCFSVHRVFFVYG